MRVRDVALEQNFVRVRTQRHARLCHRCVRSLVQSRHRTIDIFRSPVCTNLRHWVSPRAIPEPLYQTPIAVIRII
jgi:hypothetical protein